MSDSDGDSEPGSLVPILASELYPKLELIADEENLTVPFPMLHGESVYHLGRTSEGVAALSNFRFFVRFSQSFVNIPLGLIDSIECRDIFFLYIYCKDARSVRCTFLNNETCLEWYKRLSQALTHPTKITQVFAFAFQAWCRDACPGLGLNIDGECGAQLCMPCDSMGYSFGKEVERLGYDLKSAWRISYVNENFGVCSTYPKLHLVPARITDKELEAVSSFRTSRRLPSVVWRDVKSGAVLVRSSQPEVGWLGWRNSQDESLLQAISKACCDNPGSQRLVSTPSSRDEASLVSSESDNGVSKMLIVDARSYAAAVANRAKGGGVECSEYYTNCEIQFMNLANIHTIRKSFHALRALCSSPPDQPNWLTMLENSKWLIHISGLMRAALIVVNTIEKEGRPVLVHCSDGWDRTPQITALSELFLDPYYRTIEGFRVLVEKEWLEFGHKFADRCGHGVCTPDTNERCPVFLQFLDCVHQTLQQFPCAFQFNEAFLVKLVQHTYSCLFGTFLENHTNGRLHHKVLQQTSSVWSLLRPSNTKFRNYLYSPNAHQVLHPSYHLRHMYFWSAVYLSDATEAAPGDSPPEQPPEETDSADNSPNNELETDQTLLPKTRSCDDIVAAVEANAVANGSLPRRLSDPNIVTDPKTLMVKDLETGLAEDADHGDVEEQKMVGRNGEMDEEEDEGREKSPSPTQEADGKKEEVGRKQIVIQGEESVQFNALASSESDIDLTVNATEEGNLMKESDDNANEDHLPTLSLLDESGNYRYPTEAVSSSPQPTPRDHHSQVVATTQHSTEELDTSLPLRKQPSSEATIETSTDTLTGELEQGAAALTADSRVITRGPTSAEVPPCEHGSKQESADDDEDDDTTCELTASLNGVLPLEKSTHVSTSTTDISDSHVLGGIAHAYAQNKATHNGHTGHNGHMQSSAMRLENLAKLHIPEAGKYLEFGLTPSQVASVQGCISGPSSGSSRDSDTYTPPAGTSRTPSTSSPSTPAIESKTNWRWVGKGTSASCVLDCDGLVTWMSTGQARLVQMEAEYQARIEQLQRQLHAACLALSHYANGTNGALTQPADNQDNNSLADSQESGERASSLTSDMSWEQVEEKDAKMTLWVPDHAVTHCAGCDLEFWIVRRRHHCRNCGRVFCNECTNYSIPVPQQQLNTPVRVCRQCFVNIISENPSMASTLTTTNGGSITLSSSSFSTLSASQFLSLDSAPGGPPSLGPGSLVYTNGHGLVNGNSTASIAAASCNGVHGPNTQHHDRHVTVSSS